MSLLDNLPHRVTHSRKKYTNDEYLGKLTETEELATDISAWVQNASHREVQEYKKLDEQISHKVLYSTDPGIRPGDKITVTSGPSFVGVELHYRSSTDRSAGLGWMFTVMCDEEDNKREAFDD